VTTPKKDDDRAAGERPHYGGAKSVVELVQLVLTVGGVLASAFSFAEKSPRWLPWVSVGVVVLGVGWHFAAKWWRRRRRQRPAALDAKPGGGALLRGLLPFEQNEQLLGRDNDLRQVLAKIASSEFRFGSVSGDAGVGKTSFLRAGVVTEVAASGQPVFYVPRPGADPLRAIAKAIKATQSPSDQLPEGATLRESLWAAAKARPGRRVLVVCDQLDEFFIACRTQSARRFFVEAVGDCHADEDLPVSFLFGLRKEFVSDLHDFAPRVPQPLDARFSHRLRNWEPDEAYAVLDAAARHDRVPFAEALQTAIVRDLERGGEVRPVELQLVATRLNEQRVYDVGKYRDAGRAGGVLESFVKEIIDPPGAQTPEEERQVARHLLRSLCADNAEAKRPTGLTSDELARRIRATLAAAGQGNLIQSDETFDATLGRVLRRCQDAFLVIQEDEQRHNLIHDYIVRAIRDATADIETVEERANRLLDQYLEDQRRNARATIPFRHLRFVTRFASPERKLAAHRLIRRTRLHLLARASVVALGTFALLTVLLPRGRHLEQEVIEIPEADWILSKDRRAAVSRDREGKPTVWRTDQPWDSRIRIDIKLEAVAISPRSDFLAGLTPDGKVYVWRSDEPLARDARPAASVTLRADSSRELSSRLIGFSPDGKLAYALSPVTGEFFLWQAGETPAENPVLDAKLRLDRVFYGPLPVLFSPRGKYFVVIGDDGEAKLWRSDQLAAGQPRGSFSPLLFLDRKCCRFSSGEDWLVFVSRDRKLLQVSLENFPAISPVPVSLPEGDSDPIYLVTFSPDGKWIAAKHDRIDYHVWLVNSPARDNPRPVFEAREHGEHYYGEAEFSPDGRWIALEDGNKELHVRPVGAPPAPRTEPAIPSFIDVDQSPVFGFSPSGEWIVSTDKYGGVHVWRPGQTPDLSRPQARHASSGAAFVWSKDGAHIFSYEGRDIFFGRAGEQLQQLPQNPSRISGITVKPGGRELVVFGEHHMTIISRKFYFWGIPIRTEAWPELAPIEADE
jgi:hypothetical protein